MQPLTPVAILSTTVLPLDGLYAVVGTQTIGPLIEGCLIDVPLALGLHLDNFAHGQPTVCCITFFDIPHYVGHPATKEMLESWGAVPAPAQLFAGLQVGECCLCAPIVQGQSDRAAGGSAIHQEVTAVQIEVRMIMRIA